MDASDFQKRLSKFEKEKALAGDPALSSVFDPAIELTRKGEALHAELSAAMNSLETARKTLYAAGVHLRAKSTELIGKLGASSSGTSGMQKAEASISQAGLDLLRTHLQSRVLPLQTSFLTLEHFHSVITVSGLYLEIGAVVQAVLDQYVFHAELARKKAAETERKWDGIKNASNAVPVVSEVLAVIDGIKYLMDKRSELEKALPMIGGRLQEVRKYSALMEIWIDLAGKHLHVVVQMLDPMSGTIECVKDVCSQIESQLARAN